MLGSIPRKFSPYNTGGVRVAWTVGAEAANAIAVTGVVTGANGRAVPYAVVDVYLSGTAAVGDIVGTAPTGGVAVGTSGKILVSQVANKMFKVKCDSAGTFQLVLTDTGTPTFYAHAVLPDGVPSVSPAVTFA